MHPRQFALIAGVILLFMGVTSFLPAFSSDLIILPPLVLDTSYSNYLGLFPMNIVNKLALCIFGVAGIWAYFAQNALPASIRVARAMAIVMIPGAILGLIPATRTVFGYWPLFGGEVVAHGLFGVLGAYFGYALPAKARSKIQPLLDADKTETRKRVA